MKFSSNTTNALFSLLVFGTLAPTLAFWDHTLEDWFSPGDSNWWDAAPWMTPDGKLPDGFLDWDNYGEQRETAITEFTNRFLGGNCAQSVYKMSQNVFSCEDFGSATIGPGGTYYIESGGGGGSKSYFTGDVAVGAEYTIKGPFDDPTAIATINVYTARGGDLLQTVTFNHNNAGFENPFFIGDVYGASQLIKWVDSTGKTSTIDPKNALTIAPTDVLTIAPTNVLIKDVLFGDNECIDPTRTITYKLNGGTCAQSDSTMSRSFHFTCDDASSGQTIGTAGTYYIEATGSGNNVYFSGSVPVGSEYILNEDRAFDSLGSATIKVYTSQGGDVLQTVTLNDMTCTNPLFLFDKFGASQVTEWVETSGRVVTSNLSKENVESVVADADISTGADADADTSTSGDADADSDVSTSGDANTITSTGGVAALDTGSSTATTNTVTIAAAFVVVVASAITLI